MVKGLHSILRNIQGGKVGTVETPFIGCNVVCTVYSNSSIIENKMHTEAVCVLCTGITLWGPYVSHKYSNTSKF